MSDAYKNKKCHTISIKDAMASLENGTIDTMTENYKIEKAKLEAKNEFKITSKEEYAEKLRNPKWQKKRLNIFNRDNWTCTICGDMETELQVHHTKYTVNDPWDELDYNLITVCCLCHQQIEGFKKVDEKVVNIFRSINKESGLGIEVVKLENSNSIYLHGVDAFAGVNITKSTTEKLINFLKT
jgi:hypothetical protein